MWWQVVPHHRPSGTNGALDLSKFRTEDFIDCLWLDVGGRNRRPHSIRLGPRLFGFPSAVFLMFPLTEEQVVRALTANGSNILCFSFRVIHAPMYRSVKETALCTGHKKQNHQKIILRNYPSNWTLTRILLFAVDAPHVWLFSHRDSPWMCTLLSFLMTNEMWPHWLDETSPLLHLISNNRPICLVRLLFPTSINR